MFGKKKTKKVYRDNNSRNKRYGKRYIEKSRERKPRRKEMNMKVNILFGSLLVVVIAVILLSRYTQITKIQMETTAFDKEIAELSEKRNAIKLELEEIKDSGWIEKQAKLRMNMRKANEDQIILLDIDESK